MSAELGQLDSLLCKVPTRPLTNILRAEIINQFVSRVKKERRRNRARSHISLISQVKTSHTVSLNLPKMYRNEFTDSRYAEAQALLTANQLVYVHFCVLGDSVPRYLNQEWWRNRNAATRLGFAFAGWLSLTIAVKVNTVRMLQYGFVSRRMSSLRLPFVFAGNKGNVLHHIYSNVCP